jgi:hypothetical protein
MNAATAVTVLLIRVHEEGPEALDRFGLLSDREVAWLLDRLA